MRITCVLSVFSGRGVLCLLVLALGGSGCEPYGGGESIKEDASTSDTLRSLAVYDGDELVRPQSIGIVNEWLLVGDRPQPYALHVLRRSGAYVTSWGRRGRGPGEFEALWGIQAADSARAWLYDPSQSRLTLVDLREIIAESGSPELTVLNLHANVVPFSALWLSDTLLASSGTYTQGRFAIFDQRGRLKEVVGPMPPVRDGVPPQIAQHAYMGTMVRHPSRPLLAIGTRHADRLEIYQSDGRLLRVSRGPRNFEPAYEVSVAGGASVMGSGGDMRFGYIDVAASGEHIYGLYSGATRDERPGKANLGGEIHVFDWSGVRRRILLLDHLALSLAVSDDERTVYTIRHEPTPAVLKTSLPLR